MPKSESQPPLTKKRFEEILDKVFTHPVSGKLTGHVRGVRRTSESHPSDDYTEIHKSPDKIEGKED